MLCQGYKAPPGFAPSMDEPVCLSFGENPSSRMHGDVMLYEQQSLSSRLHMPSSVNTLDWTQSPVDTAAPMSISGRVHQRDQIRHDDCDFKQSYRDASVACPAAMNSSAPAVQRDHHHMDATTDYDGLGVSGAIWTSTGSLALKRSVRFAACGSSTLDSDQSYPLSHNVIEPGDIRMPDSQPEMALPSLSGTRSSVMTTDARASVPSQYVHTAPVAPPIRPAYEKSLRLKRQNLL